MTTNFSASNLSQSEAPIQFADIMRILKKYGWYLLGITILGGVLGSIWAKSQANQYDGIGLVHLTQHNSFSLSSVGGSSEDYSLKVATEVMGMTSPAIAEETMRQLNMPANPAFNSNPAIRDLNNPVERDYLVQMFTNNLTVVQKNKTELIQVTFRSKSPVLSAMVVNTLIDVYFRHSFETRYQSTGDIQKFLMERMDQLRTKIRGEQMDLLNAEAKLGILDSGDHTGSTILQARIQALLGENAKAQATEILAEAEYQNMLNHPDSPQPVDIPGMSLVAELIGQQASVRGQLAAMESKFGPNYPGVAQLKSQEAELEKSIGSARVAAMDAAKHAVQTAKDQETSIERELSSLQAQAQGSTPEAVQMEVVKANYMSDQALLNALLAALGTGSIQAGLQGQDLNRFMQAEIPGLKAFPITRVCALAGAALGLVLGSIILGILVMNSDTLETVDQIEQILPIPVLAAVPEYKDEIAAMRIAEEALPLVTLLSPRSAGSEAYRLLRTAITLMPVSQKHRVISLTSCGPGEGKSTTTMNLAVVLATQAKRVLLIDADLRKPTIAQRLKLPVTDKPGLSRFLSDETVLAEDCVQSVEEVAGLDVIPVQEIPPFPSELLGQGRLEVLLAWARDHYDYVLIDTPPVLLVTDALIVASHCDTLLTVVRVGVAQKRALRRIRQDISKFPGKQMGLVVNALPIADTYYGGYGNYRKYYGRKGYGSYGYGEKDLY